MTAIRRRSTSDGGNGRRTRTGLNMPLSRRERQRDVTLDGRLRVGFMGLDFERNGLRDLIAAIDADTSLQ
jgi:hypothetical protein